MGNIIHIPEGEEGDEILIRLLPKLHAMAQGERHDETF